MTPQLIRKTDARWRPFTLDNYVSHMPCPQSAVTILLMEEYPETIKLCVMTCCMTTKQIRIGSPANVIAYEEESSNFGVCFHCTSQGILQCNA